MRYKSVNSLYGFFRWAGVCSMYANRFKVLFVDWNWLGDFLTDSTFYGFISEIWKKNYLERPILKQS